jgi:hypothetical protein
MSVRIVVSVVAALLAVSALGGAAAYARSASVASIEGTWFIESDTSLVSFLPGGVVLSSNPPLELTNSGAQRYNTQGYGAWAHLESGGYAFTITFVQTDDKGAPVRRMLVDGTTALDDAGEHFTARFRVRGLTPEGQEVFTTDAITAAATRIRTPTL